MLSKISWDLTITDISQTWVCETLDCIATKYIRKWLELPLSATLSNVFLQKNKFGLNVILPSTKFTLLNVERSKLYVDLPGFISPSVITGDQLRPDFLLAIENKVLCILELTVGFETNLKTNSVRKHENYLPLIADQKKKYNQVKFINVSVSSLGVFAESTKSLFDMLQDLKYDEQHIKYVKKKIIVICIRTSYYIFCKRNKDWKNPELLEI